ncbi:MAG TPA: cytochrome c [Polyangia bacterium]
MRWFLFAALVAGGCSSSGSSANGDGGALAEDGAQFVVQRQCPTCHQGSGKGKLAGSATAVAGTFAYSSNLTPDRVSGIGGWADEQIIRAIRYGFDDENEELCPTMPRFDTMSDEEAQAIVAYLHSLPSVSNTIPESYCPPVKPPPGPDMAMPDM